MTSMLIALNLEKDFFDCVHCLYHQLLDTFGIAEYFKMPIVFL